MNRFAKFIFGLIILFVCNHAYSADDISIEIILDRDTIGMDEQATMIVTVSGENRNLPSPMLPTLSVFEVYSQGSSTNLSIVNGEVTASNSYQYLLLPTKPGSFPIDNIAVVFNNKRYKAKPVQLTVINKGTSASPQIEDRARSSEGTSKDYFLEAIVDNSNPYVGQQVTFTLKFYIAVQYYGSPELSEPTTTGFWTEILGNKAPYYQRINNRKYKVIERKYALFPTHTGDLTIGRATIRATVANRNQRSRDPFNALGSFFGRGVEIKFRSKAIRVNVKALPEINKPASFTGSIGKFAINTSADKRVVEVNQPVTVTINISGTGNVKSVAEPIIPELPDFRIYRASTNEQMSKSDDRIGGRKIYEEVFIPKRPGNLEVPVISYNYFDPETKRYKKISSKPIKINVVKPEGYAASPDVPYASPDLTISSQARDIRYIKENIGDILPSGKVILFTPLYLFVNGFPVLILAGMVFVRVRRERLTSNIGLARSKAAARMAKKRLASAKALAQQNTISEFFAEISLTLMSFIADKMNISPHGLTTDKIEEMLVQYKASENLINEIKEVLQKSDFARYAPSSLSQADIDDSLKKAEDIMISLAGVKFEK